MEYLDPEDGASGKRLPRRVKKRLSFDLRRDLGRFTIGGRLLAEGDRFDNAGNTVRVNGFTTIDLSGEYRFSDRLTLRAKLANLLDEEYRTVNTYNSFDRNFFLSFHYRSR
jgi:vitamin B12 transporter